MLRVALQEYQGRIEGLIEQNRLPEAAAHCHFLLQQYPRHIGTYRLFGRALLEQQLYRDSLDIFKRVISADPEDLLAHAGLALAYREEKDLNRALWHMERAFEMEPFNRAIQNELRDLHERLGQKTARMFSLNNAALARIYFKGGLYGKAAVETKALLETYPDRFDLQVLLLDIYYWSDRRKDADKQSKLVLDRLPFCIKANAILAEIRLKKGQIQEAKKHLSNLQSVTLMAANDVDSESTVGYILTNHPDIVLPDKISVDALGEIGPTSAQLSYDSEWLQEISVEQEIEIKTTPTVEETNAIIETSFPEESLALIDEEDIDWTGDLSYSDNNVDMLQDQEILDIPLGIDQSVDEAEASHPSLEQVEEVIDFQQSSVPGEEEIQESDLSLGEFGDELPSWTDLNEEKDLMGSLASDEPKDDGWLEQIAPSQSANDGLPKWIYENMGFSDEMEDSSDFDLPDWLQDSLGDDEITGVDTETVDLPLESKLVANQETSEKLESPDSPDEVELIDDETAAINFEEDLSWEPTIEDLLTGTDELIDRTTSPPPDQPVSNAFDALPWLDDMLRVDETAREENDQANKNPAGDDQEPLDDLHTEDN